MQFAFLDSVVIPSGAAFQAKRRTSYASGPAREPNVPCPLRYPSDPAIIFPNISFKIFAATVAVTSPKS